jgi:hypothetical protein
MLMHPGEAQENWSAERSDFRFRWSTEETATPLWPRTFRLTLGAAFHRLDCIAGIRLWVFEAKEADDDKKPGTSTTNKTWHRLDLLGLEDGNAWSRLPHDGSGVAWVSFSPENHALLGRLTQTGERRVLQAFCEVRLKAPAALKEAQWVKDMNCSDPWFFPVEMGIRMVHLKPGVMTYQPYLGRRVGEFGEVPDWRFWTKYYGEKEGGQKKEGELRYPDPRDVIRPFPDKKP